VIMKKKVEYSQAILIVNSAAAITNKSVILSGNVTSNNKVIKNLRFEYGTGLLMNEIVYLPDSVQPNISFNPNVNLKDLKPNTTYNFRLTAKDIDTEYSSNMLQFTTLPDYTLSMNYVYTVASNEADVSGNIVSNASDITNIEFQYGTDTTFTFKTVAQPAIIYGNTSKTIAAHLSSLKSQTRYYIRIKANYNSLVVYSLPVIFTTGSEYLITISNPAITGNTAKFNTYIAANKDTIRNVVFEYGTSREYKNHIDDLTQINKGTYNYIATQLTGLDSAAVYYYRIKANLGKDIIYSAENIFNVKRTVVMIPIETKQLSDSSINLRGLVNANGVYLTNIRFQFGRTKNFGDSIPGTPYYVYNYGTSLVSSTLKHLTPGVNYYARISATNGTNRYYSEVFSFTSYPNALDSLNDESRTLIYPNPASNYLFIKSDKEVSKVEISDFFGKLLLSTKGINDINILQWPKGIYFVRIYLEDKFITKKLIKN